MEIGLVVTGDRTVALRLERLPDDVHERILAKIATLTNQLLARVIAAEPTRTGRLRSETRAFVDDRPDFIRGRVRVTGGRLKYEHGKAAALEYGAHGTVTVTEHVAKRNTVFGRTVAPYEAIVDRYTRHLNIVAERFLRGPLEAMRGEIVAELQQALNQAVRES